MGSVSSPSSFRCWPEVEVVVTTIQIPYKYSLMLRWRHCSATFQLAIDCTRKAIKTLSSVVTFMLWFGENHLLFKELTSVLCQMQVIVANSSTEDYPHPDDHICLKYVWVFSNQILYRHVVCFVKRQSFSLKLPLWTKAQPYDDIQLAYSWQGWNHLL